MKNLTLVSALVTSLVVAGALTSAARADVTLNLGSGTLTPGGASYFQYTADLTGSLTGFHISFDYVADAFGAQYASDMAFRASRRAAS